MFVKLLAGLLVLASSTLADDLVRDFKSPPDSARPWVWAHWLHGNVSRQSITTDLESIKRVGLGGVTMFDVAQPGIPPGPHQYMDPAWQQLFAHQIAEAHRLGLQIMSHNGPGYSGNGGPWITPELASQKLVHSETRLTGPQKFAATLPQPPANGDFYRDVAILAIKETDAQAAYRIEGLDLKRLVWLNYIKWTGTRSAPLDAAAPAEVCIPPAAIVNITHTMKPDGSVHWDVPPGQWTLLRFGHTWTGQNTLPATPASLGPECDKLDPRGIRAHFNHVMKRMVDLAGPSVGKTFIAFFVDSWEAGGQNWTVRMPQEFKQRRGYDITPFLPVITGRVVGDLQTSERFLYDLRQTVSELVTENFWQEMRRLCHEHGMKLAVEPYITTGNDLDAANHTDEPMGELWTAANGPSDYRVSIRAAASVANLNGHAIVGVEAFTANHTERWLSHPAKLKPFGDQMFCLGANRLQVHRFAMQRFDQLRPGMMMGGWGQQYDRTQTWWEWSRPWHDYLARCQFMLRQGPVVADVLAVVPEEPLYRFEPNPLTGHVADFCGPDTFKRIVNRGNFVGIPDGPSYRLITVDHTGTMTLARIKKLRDLVASGAALLGEPPVATPGLTGQPQADEELRTIAAELWGTTGETERPLGKGLVFRGMKPEEALARLGHLPDFASDQNLTWIHRTRGDMDIYFISSASDAPVDALCTFRVTGKQAELWDPLTGTIRPLRITAAADHRTQARIPLEPSGSAFIIFRPASAQGASASPAAGPVPAPTGSDERVIQTVAGPWRVAFPATRGGQPTTVDMDQLVSWSEHPNKVVKHFAGEAVYRTQFTLDRVEGPMVLDLGRVEVMARVKVNGKDLGIVWRKPYRIDITESAAVGVNELEVTVVNLWVNRLIGDEALPVDSKRDKRGRLEAWPQWVLEGKASPTGRQSFVTFRLWKADEPLVESGLLGPVKLVVEQAR